MVDQPRDRTHDSSEGIDPVSLEVIDSRLNTIVREMQYSMFRTGYSTIVRDSKDGSAGICLPDGRLIGQDVRNPLHVGSFTPTIETILDWFDSTEIREGDTFIVNDPYLCGANHSPNMFVVTPVFYDGDLQMFCTNVAHKPDIGGLVPGTSSPDARELYHEGLQLPPVKFRQEGETNTDIENIIRNNSRVPEIILGDVRGQVGCSVMGTEKIQALFEEYGPETVHQASEIIIESTRSKIVDQIRQWDGCETVEGFLDNDASSEDPVRLELEVQTDAGCESIRFDFSESDPQTSGPVNLQPQGARAACYISLAGMIDPKLHLNAGIADVCEFDLPEGSVVHPHRPAPCNHYTYAAFVAGEMCLRALSAFEPTRAVAGTGGKCALAFGTQRQRLSGPRSGPTTSRSESNENDQSSEWTGQSIRYEILGSGFGGHTGADGSDCMASTYDSNVELTSIEILETGFPVRVAGFSVYPDSAGAGDSRGGIGYTRTYEFLEPCQFTYRGSTHKFTSEGIAGGKSPVRARAVAQFSNDDPPESFDTIHTVRLAKGDRVELSRPGGAGYGEPHDRDPEQVLEDVKSGFVTVEEARTSYGVVVNRQDGELVVDLEATHERRG